MTVIFLDADGTLFHPNGYIPQSALEACWQVQKNGHKLCLCTGRQKMEIYGDLLKINYDAIVAGSGAHIEVKDTVLHDECFTKKQMQQLVLYFVRHQIPAIYESWNCLYCTQSTMNQLVELTKKVCKNLSDETYEKHGLVQIIRNAKVVQSFYDYPINKITFLSSDTPYKKIEEDLKKDFDVVPATFEPLGKESGEIASLSISKADGMDRLLKYWNMPSKECIAIGDGFNDLCMFEYAKTSIAMKNADPIVQKKADWVTASLEDDGIQKAFKKLALL